MYRKNDAFFELPDDELEFSSLRSEPPPGHAPRPRPMERRVDLARPRLSSRQRAVRFGIPLGTILLGLGVVLMTPLLPLARQTQAPVDPNSAVFLLTNGKF